MTNDCKWENEVRKALGHLCYDHLLDEVDANRISAKQTLDIARMLHKTVGGNFDKASNAQHFTYDRHAFRNVLSDWYKYASKEVTRDRLIEILNDKNIELSALSDAIEKQLLTSTQISNQETPDFNSLRKSLQGQNPPRAHTSESHPADPSPPRGNDSGFGTRKPSLEALDTEANNQNPPDVAIELQPLAAAMGPGVNTDRQTSELQELLLDPQKQKKKEESTYTLTRLPCWMWLTFCGCVLLSTCVGGAAMALWKVNQNVLCFFILP